MELPELLAALSFASVRELGRLPQKNVQDLLAKHRHDGTITDQDVLAAYSEWLAEQIPRIQILGQLRNFKDRPAEIRRWCDFISSFRMAKHEVLHAFRKSRESRKVTCKSRVGQAWRYAIRNVEIDYKFPSRDGEDKPKQEASRRSKKTSTAAATAPASTAPATPTAVNPAFAILMPAVAVHSQACTATALLGNGGVDHQGSTVADAWASQAWREGHGGYYPLVGFPVDRGQITSAHRSPEERLSPDYGPRPMSSTVHSPDQDKTEPPSPSYVCFRCGGRGHPIKVCPTNLDPSYDVPPGPDYRCTVCSMRGDHHYTLCPQNEHPNSLTQQRRRLGVVSSCGPKSSGEAVSITTPDGDPAPPYMNPERLLYLRQATEKSRSSPPPRERRQPEAKKSGGPLFSGSNVLPVGRRRKRERRGTDDEAEMGGRGSNETYKKRPRHNDKLRSPTTSPNEATLVETNPSAWSLRDPKTPISRREEKSSVGRLSPWSPEEDTKSASFVRGRGGAQASATRPSITSHPRSGDAVGRHEAAGGGGGSSDVDAEVDGFLDRLATELLMRGAVLPASAGRQNLSCNEPAGNDAAPVSNTADQVVSALWSAQKSNPGLAADATGSQVELCGSPTPSFAPMTAGHPTNPLERHSPFVIDLLGTREHRINRVARKSAMDMCEEGKEQS